MLSFNDNNAHYLIVNSELTGSDTLKKNESGAIVLPFDGPVIYEVIRFINGKGLFPGRPFPPPGKQLSN